MNLGFLVPVVLACPLSTTGQSGPPAGPAQIGTQTARTEKLAALLADAKSASDKSWRLAAEELFDEAVRVNPTSSTAYLGRAKHRIKYNRVARALEDARKALELDASSGDARSLVEELTVQLKTLEDEAGRVRLRADREPKDVHSRAQLCMLYHDLCRDEKTLAASEESLRADPKDAAGLMNKGAALCELKRWDDAKSIYRVFLREKGYSDSNYGAAHMGIALASDALARTCLRENDREAARQHRKNAVEALAAARKLRSDDPTLKEAEGGLVTIP